MDYELQRLFLEIQIKKKYVGIFKYSCYGALDWKENKDVGTISFELERKPEKLP